MLFFFNCLINVWEPHYNVNDQNNIITQMIVRYIVFMSNEIEADSVMCLEG